MRRTAHRSRLVLAAVLLAAGLSACDDPVGPTEDPTGPDPEEPSEGPADDAAYPDDLVVEVESLSGSVPPPFDSLETVTIGPEGLTYTAGSRYEDEPMYSETVPADDGELEEVMAAWEALDVPVDTGDGYDQSHSSVGAGGSYVITHVNGTGYGSTATGDDDPIFELVDVALDQVPQQLRDEGQAAIEEYNASEDG